MWDSLFMLYQGMKINLFRHSVIHIDRILQNLEFCF